MAVFAKEAYRSGVSVPSLLALRFAIAAGAFWAIVAVRRPVLPPFLGQVVATADAHRPGPRARLRRAGRRLLRRAGAHRRVADLPAALHLPGARVRRGSRPRPRAARPAPRRRARAGQRRRRPGARRRGRGGPRRRRRRARAVRRGLLVRGVGLAVDCGARADLDRRRRHRVHPRPRARRALHGEHRLDDRARRDRRPRHGRVRRAPRARAARGRRARAGGRDRAPAAR